MLKTVIKYLKNKIKTIYVWYFIPKGSYCYKIIEIDRNHRADGLPIMKVKRCPYWCWDKRYPGEDVGYCKYLGIGDKDENGSGLLWDQIKECGVNDHE